MLMLNELLKMTHQQYPDQSITLPRALRTWSTDPAHQNELRTLLEPCGLSLEQVIQTTGELTDVPESQDEQMLIKALTEGIAGQPYAAALLKVISDSPHYRLTKEWVRLGLDLQCLKKSLKAIQPEISILAKVIAETNAKTPELEKYSRCLTDLAKEGLYANLFPRKEALDQLILVLLKTQKGNAVITGPAGAGKTALVELFAHAIVNQEVPEQLRDVEIFEISMSKLVAGTMYRGQFEERMEKVLAELQNYPSAILFIDEMHLIWGAGRTSESVMDASNILKPILTSGKTRIIGATTTEEYHRYITQDRALERRFEEIPLTAPSGEMLLNIVNTSSQAISQKTGVAITETCIRSAIRLTDQYLPNRSQPDKTINLLDMAATKARLGKQPAVTEELLRAILSSQTGYRIENLDAPEKDNLIHLENRIRRQIIGQAEAVSKVVQTLIYRRQLPASASERNMGTFLFSGPTGVGKTELGRILAKELFSGLEHLLQIDLAEYSHGADISRLIGAAPGLVGYENPGLLASFLRSSPGGVIIFDEIEKAHKEVQDFLLGILDNGRLRTGKGELLSTRAAIIIVTTNVLKQADLQQRGIGFTSPVQKVDARQLLDKHFPAEFLARFDELIVFRALSPEDLNAIINLRIDESLQMFAEKGITVHLNRETLLRKILVNLNDDGARGVQRAIEKVFAQQVAYRSLADKNVTWEAVE